MKNSSNKDSEVLNYLVEILYSHGIQKKNIAFNIGIPKSDTSDLSKLCDGTLKSCNRKSVKDYINSIYEFREFEKILTKNAINFSLYSRIFIFYYWSSNKHIGIAFIGINEEELEKSDFYYLTKTENGKYIVGRRSRVFSFEHKGKPTLEIILKKNKDVSTFITAHIGSVDLDDVKLTYCSFCGGMGSNPICYSGIGILEQVNSSDYLHLISTIEHYGIPYSITNALYSRRIDLSNSEREVFSSYKEIQINQIKNIQGIAGYWLGYYARKDITDGDIKGGIAKVLMYIDRDGTVKVYYQYNSGMTSYTPDYYGIVQFPHSKTKSIIVFELESYKRTHRIRFLLALNGGKLKGNFSGWTDKGILHFTRAMYLEKIDISYDENSEKTLDILMKKHQPNGISRKNITSDENYISELIRVETDTIHSINFCVGNNLPTTIQKKLF